MCPTFGVREASRYEPRGEPRHGTRRARPHGGHHDRAGRRRRLRPATKSWPRWRRFPNRWSKWLSWTADNGDTRKRPPEIVIATLGDDEETWALQIQEIRHGAPRGAVIGAISERSGRQGATGLARRRRRRLLSAGPTQRSVAMPRAGLRDGAGGGAHSATICSITSVAGGVGVSSLAVALGFALTRQGSKRVALIDLGLQCGTLAAILDLTSRIHHQ